MHSVWVNYVIKDCNKMQLFDSHKPCGNENLFFSAQVARLAGTWSHVYKQYKCMFHFTLRNTITLSQVY